MTHIADDTLPLSVHVQKWLNRSRCHLGYGLGKHVLGGVHTGATWRIPLYHPRMIVMRRFFSNCSDHLLLLLNSDSQHVSISFS